MSQPMVNTGSIGLPQWLSGKESSCNAGDVGLILGSARSPEGENGNPLHHSCLENPMDRGAQWALAQGVAKKSDTVLTTIIAVAKICSQN